jgi:hypothetical protein
MNKRAWAKLIAQNRRPILKLVKQGIGKYRDSQRKRSSVGVLPQPM